MPNAMLALPNIGGALCSTPQRVSDTQPCGNAAKTRKPLTLAGMPDRSQPLVGRSSYCCLTRFFRCEDIAQQSCTTVRPVFPASRVHTRILKSHQNLIGYISAISIPIYFWFSPKLAAVQGLQT